MVAVNLNVKQFYLINLDRFKLQIEELATKHI